MPVEPSCHFSSSFITHPPLFPNFPPLTLWAPFARSNQPTVNGWDYPAPSVCFLCSFFSLSFISGKMREDKGRSRPRCLSSCHDCSEMTLSSGWFSLYLFFMYQNHGVMSLFVYISRKRVTMAFILSQIVDCGKDKAAGVSFTWSTSRQNTEKKSMFENEN